MKIQTAFAFATVATIAIALCPAAASADDTGQNACIQDAFSICGQFIPNRERVAACLFSNRERVSPGCRSALTHFNPRTASST
jgi:hypothetical protein